jgi:hypothetical protein
MGDIKPMNEADWLTCPDPRPLLEMVQEEITERKLRLFACACVRRVWDQLTDERSRVAVKLAELAADQPVPYRELDQASGEAEEAFEDALDIGKPGSVEDAARATQIAAAAAASYASNPDLRDCGLNEVLLGALDASAAGASAELGVQANLLRDIVLNPFRSVAVDRAWLTPAAVAIARHVYDKDDFLSLPVLADALEDAGCDNAVILAHLRGPGPHVRGCWALDLILGKE